MKAWLNKNKQQRRNPEKETIPSLLRFSSVSCSVSLGSLSASILVVFSFATGVAVLAVAAGVGAGVAAAFGAGVAAGAEAGAEEGLGLAATVETKKGKEKKRECQKKLWKSLW
jgi:hypothetical protein